MEVRGLFIRDLCFIICHNFIKDICLLITTSFVTFIFHFCILPKAPLYNNDQFYIIGLFIMLMQKYEILENLRHFLLSFN